MTIPQSTNRNWLIDIIKRDLGFTSPMFAEQMEGIECTCRCRLWEPSNPLGHLSTCPIFKLADS
jgi:hypothetical protein